MPERTRRTLVVRDRLLEEARKELLEFEHRENEFRKKDREELATELRLPVTENQNSLARNPLSRRSLQVRTSHRKEKEGERGD